MEKKKNFISTTHTALYHTNPAYFSYIFFNRTEMQ